MDVGDYHVACCSAVRGRDPEDAPGQKVHAHRAGAQKTACGFGLAMMRTVSTLPYLDQPPSTRCPICDRHVRAAARR
jgi:hypothetical protein